MLGPEKKLSYMDSTGRLAIPRSPRNMDMKMGSWRGENSVE